MSVSETIKDKLMPGILIFILALSFLVIAGEVISYFKSKPVIPMGKAEITLGKTIVYADIADMPAEREQGLSGRPFLADNEGMLFIFDSPVMPAFWMKDMNFALDIIWIEENGNIASTTKDLRPESYPNTVSPAVQVKYVLEVPSGFIQKNGIETGSLVRIRK